MTQPRQEPAGGGHHALVYLYKADAIDLGMFHDLPDRPAVAPPNHQGLLRLRMGNEGDVGDHLMIDKLILLGGLHGPIENQHPAIEVGVQNSQLLEGSLLHQEAFPHPQIQSEVFRLFLSKPKRHISAL